ncbi:hypothetical protein [Dickeya phage Sucellus]|nr:hypothetical protein [Dickeya phage Sucellus]
MKGKLTNVSGISIQTKNSIIDICEAKFANSTTWPANLSGASGFYAMYAEFYNHNTVVDSILYLGPVKPTARQIRRMKRRLRRGQ